MKQRNYATAAAALLLGPILLLSPPSDAFAPSSSSKVSPPARRASPAARRTGAAAVPAAGGGAGADDDDPPAAPPSSPSPPSRRDVLCGTLAAATAACGAAFLAPLVPPAYAAPAAVPAGTVVVAGATGQTGRRILERLASMSTSSSSSSPSSALSVVGGVRDVGRARKSLSESSTVVRGAMVQRVDSVNGAGLELRRLDVATDSVDEMASALAGAAYLVIAVGFVPGNPLRMNAAAHEVDNVGTCKLIDAAKAAGVKKVVMISSILSNGRAWGQEKSPGFVVTNAFGNVLDEKIVAENHLRSSGMDWTIVRPGGLKAKPPTGALRVSGEDTLNAGEISRDLVADVCVACLTDAGARDKVLEIIEDAESEPSAFNGLSM